jgi:hypothetical protein
MCIYNVCEPVWHASFNRNYSAILATLQMAE